MNTENSQTNEPHKIRLALDLHTTTKNLKFLLQLDMTPLISLMEAILFLIYKIIFNILLKNMKL